MGAMTPVNEWLSLWPLFLVTTMTIALNSVYFKCMLNSYKGDPASGDPHDYAVFVSVFGIFLWAIFMSAVGKVGGWGSTAAKFQRQGLLRAAAFDQLGTLLATLGASTVSGQLQVLLNQAVLPLTMAMSLVLLGRRYSFGEVLGASLVLVGASAAAGVSAFSDSWRQSSHSGILFLSLAQFAVAGAALTKERLLRAKHFRRNLLVSGTSSGATCVEDEPIADPVALGVAVAWIRVPLGVLLALGFRTGRGNLFEEFRDGWLCFCGFEPRLGDIGCPVAARNTFLSVALYAGQTLLGLRLTQRCNATMRSMAGVTALPLAQFLFTSKVLMTDLGAETYNSGSAMGLSLCLIGFFIYLGGCRS